MSERGRDGLNGRNGLNGRDGVDGADGATGARGERGAAGATGPTGATGPAGPEGPEGAPGRPGQDGADGRDGADGTDGVRGDDGATGPVGPQGPTGATGERGPKGMRGEQGDIGPMPRHEWDGTSLRFERLPDVWGEYVDLRGPTGATGATGRNGGGGAGRGATGATGPAGPTGATGATGPAGGGGGSSSRARGIGETWNLTGIAGESPADGEVTLNEVADPTEIYLSRKTASNAFYSGVLDQMQPGSIIRIADDVDANWLVFAVESINDSGDYLTFVGTTLNSVGALTPTETVYLSFSHVAPAGVGAFAWSGAVLAVDGTGSPASGEVRLDGNFYSNITQIAINQADTLMVWDNTIGALPVGSRIYVQSDDGAVRGVFRVSSDPVYDSGTYLLAVVGLNGSGNFTAAMPVSVEFDFYAPPVAPAYTPQGFFGKWVLEYVDGTTPNNSNLSIDTDAANAISTVQLWLATADGYLFTDVLAGLAVGDQIKIASADDSVFSWCEITSITPSFFYTIGVAVKFGVGTFLPSSVVTVSFDKCAPATAGGSDDTLLWLGL